MTSRNSIRLAVARGYAHPNNRCKPIDLELIEAMVDEVDRVLAREQRISKALASEEHNDDVG